MAKGKRRAEICDPDHSGDLHFLSNGISDSLIYVNSYPDAVVSTWLRDVLEKIFQDERAEPNPEANYRR